MFYKEWIFLLGFEGRGYDKLLAGAFKVLATQCDASACS